MIGHRRRWSMVTTAIVAVAVVVLTCGAAFAGPGVGVYADGSCGNPTYYANSPAGVWVDACGQTHNSGTAMRKFVDPLPGAGGPTAGIPSASANNIPLAIANTPYGSPFADADYYEIGIVEYREQLHSDLPATGTRLRGYVQLVPGLGTYTDILGNTYTGVQLTNLDGTPLTRVVKGVTVSYYGLTQPRYLGPIIVATKGKPVRIKYTNLLPIGVDPVTGTPKGELFIPTDRTLMGAGLGPDNVNSYTDNRIAIHLHGGYSPWVSDGTPHQWIVPVGETAATWMQGASFENVPDMNDPGQGSGTLYYTNQQASRLMFYHDHAVGITRLNVYAGAAAGYLIKDLPGTGEDWLVNGGTIMYPDPVTGPLTATLAAGIVPGLLSDIPLVIQDKTFVPFDVVNGSGTGQDQKWDTAHWGAYGDLWFPHVYETNQDPISPQAIDGTNPVGRWDWGPWFWPIFPSQFPLPTGAYGDVTTTPEAFMDTMLVNGKAYPTLTVNPQAYRFHILSAGNDRMLNLGFYVADPLTIAVTSGGSGYSATPTVAITDTNPACPTTGTAVVSAGTVTGVAVTNMGSGYTTTPAVTILAPSTCVINGTTCVQATARAVVGNVSTTVGAITGVVITNPGAGYIGADALLPGFVTIAPSAGVTAAATATVAPAGVITAINVATTPATVCNAPSVLITDLTGIGAQAYASVGTEVKMVNFDASYVPPPAASMSPDGTPYFPTTGGLMGTGWGQRDMRVGGVPDPATAGPPIIQIGTEGGLMPAPAIIPSTPINYEYNKRSVTVLNVLEHGLYLGPAERADVVVDFCRYAGQTLILYNDSPAPVPAGDPRLDYFTGGPDQSAVGGMPPTQPGFGPNTRTVMQVKVNPGACTPYDPAPLFTYLPAAYGQTQENPIVGESVYNPAFGQTFPDTYAHIATGSSQEPAFIFPDGTNVGHVNGITLTNAVKVVTLPIAGAGYVNAPAVTIAAPPCTINGSTCVQATATTGTLSVRSITLTNAGTQYTSVPQVTLTAPPAGGVQATAKATIGTTGGTRGKITAITLTNPGYGYTTVPTITITGGGGRNAAAVAFAGVTGVQAIPPVPAGIRILNSGAGYAPPPALGPNVVIAPPPCTINGTTCIQATASAAVTTLVAMPLQNKAIQELFEPVYGRMNATLGVELPFTNANTQTTIPLGYIDPATEIIADGETQIWKITHNGVDTHPVHFHLVNVQLINRIGWDGTVKPPPDNEVGWKETIRMNPLEDIVVAVRAKAPKFKFGLPQSVRPLAPSEPIGSTAGFTQIDPATGAPAVVANMVDNFDWEYVWHCHILGHEENDFMRPLVFHFTAAVPGAPSGVAATRVAGPPVAVQIAWTDPTPVATAIAGAPDNEVGFRIDRATNGNFTQNLRSFNAPANSTSFVDGTVVVGTRYYYRVATYTAAGSSAVVSAAGSPITP